MALTRVLCNKEVARHERPAHQRSIRRASSATLTYGDLDCDLRRTSFEHDLFCTGWSCGATSSVRAYIGPSIRITIPPGATQAHRQVYTMEALCSTPDSLKIRQNKFIRYTESDNAEYCLYDNHSSYYHNACQSHI